MLYRIWFYPNVFSVCPFTLVSPSSDYIDIFSVYVYTGASQ